MTERTRFSSGAPWETIVGYSRAIRVGDVIHVSGTTALDANGEVVGEGDPYRQTVQILQNIDRALAALGGSLDDVVRTRIYITDIARWEEVGRAHGELLGDVMPATSMVEVVALIDPALMVEIEAEAVVRPG